MKGLLVILGESFREGKQHSRTIGTKTSYQGQMEASGTHINFIYHLQQKNITVEVYLASYCTNYDKDLSNIYKPHLVGCDFHKERLGFTNLFYITAKKIKNINSYDFVFFLRVDLFLKQGLFDVFDPNWTTIRYPSVCWIKGCKVNNSPRVSDVMLFVPKKYYNYIVDIRNIHILNHNGWDQILRYTKLKITDLDTMINTFHDSDSYKDLNPLYYIVNRPESNFFYSKGYIFDKFAFPKVKKEGDMTDDDKKCIKPSCNYMKHKNPNNNGGSHCCKGCQLDNGHGARCAKILFRK